MSDTLRVDTPSPKIESMPSRWDFLKNFKRRVQNKFHRTSQSQETSQIIEAENVAKIEIPVPGEASIPEGNIRLFHFTYPKYIESIKSQGLTRKNHENSSDVGLNSAPDSIFAYSDLNVNEPPGWTIGKPYFEFSAPPDEMGPHYAPAKEGTVRTLKPGVEISPDKIVAIHEPWHEMVRHSKDNVIDSEWLKAYVDKSLFIAGNHGTRGNYINYSEMTEQRKYLESQVAEANKYLAS